MVPLGVVGCVQFRRPVHPGPTGSIRVSSELRRFSQFREYDRVRWRDHPPFAVLARRERGKRSSKRRKVVSCQFSSSLLRRNIFSSRSFMPAWAESSSSLGVLYVRIQLVALSDGDFPGCFESL